MLKIVGHNSNKEALRRSNCWIHAAELQESPACNVTPYASDNPTFHGALVCQQPTAAQTVSIVSDSLTAHIAPTNRGYY